MNAANNAEEPSYVDAMLRRYAEAHKEGNLDKADIVRQAAMINERLADAVWKFDYEHVEPVTPEESARNRALVQKILKEQRKEG